MFGDLFAEEKDEEIPVTVANGKNVIFHSSHTYKKSLPQPPLPRSPTNLCGLINQGGTCYLNSLIQTLFFTPEFREQLLRLGQDELGELSSEFSCKNKARVIPLQLQHLFSQMLLLNRASISTSQLTDSFGWTQNEGFQQHDVQELNRILFSAIEYSLVGTTGENLIRNLYHGTLVSKITCQECGKVSEREEDFLDLQMILTSCTSLEQSLKMSYVMAELMSGDNQYMCENCNKLVNAARESKLRSLPSILTFSLVRFAYDLQKFERYKETKRYTFPLELDMKEFCENGKDDDVYELYSVVIHRGSCYGGHYHAYIRNFDGLGNWTSPDEQEPAKLCGNRKENGQSTEADDIDHNNPAQLVSFLVTSLGGKATISELCQSMVKETDISWNKTFKKRHGPLMKFIKKHNDMFDLVDGSVVTLKGCAVRTNEEGKPSNTTSKNDNDHDGANGNHSSLDSSPPNEEKRNEILNAKCSSGCWFDLNDANISCINEQDIKKQFAGKESAYMLFYRRKDLQPTRIVENNLESSLPDNLVAEVISMNLELEKQREEYDLELNRISVMLHFCCDYTVKDGVIVPKEQISIGPSVFTLDRRKNVIDFLHLVDERCLLSEEVIHDLTVHLARNLSAGMHLYDDITACKSRSLVEWGVNDGSDLFIWCGKQVDGHYIRTGGDCEPVLLSITYPMKDGSSIDMQKPFPKDSTLHEMKVSISRISGIKPSKLVLSIMKLSKRSKTKIEELPASLDGNTLKTLEFVDGQRLIVDKKVKQKNTNCHPLCLAKSEAEKCDNQISLVVENHINCSNGHETNSTFAERPPCPVATFYVDKHKTIRELKNQIMSSPDFKINPDQNCILRTDDVTHGLGPPLHEHHTVEEVSLDEGHNMIIEPGIPLEQHQIAVRFYCVVVGHSRHEDEIIVDNTFTIGQCLLLMVKQAGLEGSKWHLCKTNWYGEEAGAIENEDESLENAAVKHGDLLVVKEGCLPPKGFVRLSLWLLKRRYDHTKDGEGHDRTSMISWITTGLQELLGVSHHTTNGKQVEEFESLDEIEISMDAILLDLKEKIVDIILQIKEYQVKSPEFLRIQEIKDGCPARVLRHHNKTLRFSKITSSRKLSVHVLETEEDLSQSAILLNVQKRIFSQRCYGPPEQFIFDAPNGATSSSLHHCISERFGIPINRLAIAKYLRHKYEWFVISDSTPIKEKTQKNKKSNLRHSPYHLQDGDIIGIKDTSDKSTDGFSTPEDEAAKENLQRIQEVKIRRRREERRKGSSHRPEVELKIHVDDFTK